MNNPVIMGMLAREQNRRIQAEIEHLQLLNAAGYQPLGFFHRLRAWISRFPMRSVEKRTTGNESPGICQPDRV